jgi:predicted flavoprotein YhiN
VSPDVVVVGGGASGLMAAGRAAEAGASVLVLEKTERPGKKLLVTGNGRCNLSNDMDKEDFVDMYGPNGRFLYRAFEVFFREELLDFLAARGVAAKVEPDGRIFPASDDARDVLRALEAYLTDGGVRVRTGARASEIVVDAGRVRGVTVGDEKVTAEAVVLASGGASYPRTGSTGDGYRMAAAVGHRVVPLRPGLSPLAVVETQWVSLLQGVSLRNVRLTSYRGRAGDIPLGTEPRGEVGRGIAGAGPRPPVIESRLGDLMFTHFGIGGPVTIKMSLAVVDALAVGPVSVGIDLLPGEGQAELRRRLQLDFDRFGKRTLRRILGGMVAEQVAEVLLGMSGISGERTGGHIDGADRDRLATLMKSVRFNIGSALPLAEAMVTAGGVSLDEIDPRTMASRIVAGLYFCGEVMDIDADTGGYNLQAAFSTGYLAGQSAAAFAGAVR